MCPSGHAKVSLTWAIMLKIKKTISVGILEVSGIGWRWVDGCREVLLIGDRTYHLATAPWGEEPSFKLHDLRALVPGKEQEDSQWEAVAGDKSGRVFVLQESPGTVWVFAPALDRLLHTIRLVVPEDSPFAADWNRDENSRGEGFVLLQNGHILLLKEKKPPMLIEFGPAGASPSGYERGAAVDAEHGYPLPSGEKSEFVPLKSWRLSPSDQKRVGDLSDLATDPEGTLFALADQERLLVRLESSLSPGEKTCSVKETWELPSSIDKPEGLVISPGGEPFVARDVNKLRGNAYLLAPPEPEG